MLIASLAASVGVVALVATLAYRKAIEIEQLRFNRLADQHAAHIRDHLGDRETLARAVSAAFIPPDQVRPDALAQVDPRLLTFLPDLTAFVWIRRTEPAAIPALLSILKQPGFAEPRLLTAGRAPLPSEALNRVVMPVTDILPKSETNLLSLGLDLASLPAPKAALERAEASGDLAATAPLQLVQLPGRLAVVLYMPIAVRRTVEAATAGIIGFIGFSFVYEQLIGQALRRGEAPDVGVRVTDAGAAEAGALYQSDGFNGEGRLSQPYDIDFGGRRLTAVFSNSADIRAAAWRDAGVAGLSSAVIMGLAMGSAFYLFLLSRRLRLALAAEARSEAQLRAVAQELAHRLKNMFAITQAIASQTFKQVDATGEARRTFASRIHSMGQAVSLLTDNAWQGAPLRALIKELGLPLAERVRVEGPDAPIAPIAAQNLVLVIHELWTNALKHGALAQEKGRVDLIWTVDGERFDLTWQETTPTPATLPERRGFGRQLIERLAPAQLDGEGNLEATPQGVRYQLTAPRARVLAGA